MNEEGLPYLISGSCLIVFKNQHVIQCNIYELKKDTIIYINYSRLELIKKYFITFESIINKERKVNKYLVKQGIAGNRPS